ncbi:uncharacterized protein [Parasteatoda tepidariorum]|uniref:uncharacterized protein isoform X2 n=1 Tax=Parasteatoda tepidariorum TaxID=114398 RepID=UPI001C724609|nr:uncharacterized protein LOC107451968 isoform X2 [Parasteatoda tepidariorum]
MRRKFKTFLFLEQQNVIFSSVMKECDKVSSILRNSKDLGLTLNDLAIGDVNQSPICKKIDAFDTFQRRFNDNHLARRYGLSYYNIGGDVNKLPKLWDTSKIKTIEKNLLDITSR